MIHSADSLTVGKSGKRVTVRKLITPLLLLCLLVGLPSLGAFWLLSFDNWGTFRNTTNLVDVDNDGDLDMLLHNVRQEAEFTAFGGAGLWINDGEGGFVPEAVKYGGGWDSAAFDADLDGVADFLLAFDGGRLALLQGSIVGAPGTFAGGSVINGPRLVGQFGSIHVGDLNSDGQEDIFVAGCCGRLFTMDPEDDTPNKSWIWLGSWTETGRPTAGVIDVKALEGLALRDAALGDLDGDGDLDLFAAVIAPKEGRNMDPADRVLWNDGTGDFSDSGQRLGNVDSTAVALGDVDGDGDLDALIGHANGASLWLNEDGTFVLAGQKFSGGPVTAVFLQDLDDDGDTDALIGELRQARLWWNAGNGTFNRDSQRFRYSKRAGLAVGDFDGDGRPDIFTAAYDDNYRIWFNQGGGVFR